MMSPGRESDVVSVLHIQISFSDYEKLFSTNILGLDESHYSHDEFVFEKFKEQLKRSKEGWYDAGLIGGKTTYP